MNLLLLSNSATAGKPYLSHAREWIDETLGDSKRIVFVPYAAITLQYGEYARRVQENIGREVFSAHDASSASKAVQHADAVLIGGGNSFQLLRLLYRRGLMDPLKKHAKSGKPLIGWSAGSNVAAPTIRTTNDMPVVVPASMDALGLVPFQINPHFIDADPNSTHQGETREQRLTEYLEENEVPVAALREGSWLKIQGDSCMLSGKSGMKLFQCGQPPQEVASGDVSYLL